MSTSTIAAPWPPANLPGHRRVWLVGCRTRQPDPVELPSVTTGQRVWEPGPDGLMHTRDGRHHATWPELRARYDLVEV